MLGLEQLIQQMVHMQGQGQQSQQQIIQVMQQQATQQSYQPHVRAGRLTDLHGLEGPPVFNGDDVKYREWSSTLLSFIVVKWSSGLPWLA